MLNVRTATAKTLARRDFIRRMAVYERRWYQDIKKYMDQFIDQIIAAFEAGELTPEDALNSEKFARNAQAWMYDIAYYFARQAWTDLDQQDIVKGASSPEINTPMHDAFYRWVSLFTMTRTATMVQHVTQTTKIIIAHTINSMMTQGKTNADIVRQLRGMKVIMNASRARTIARTETHTAAVGGYHHAIRSSRVRMTKEWSSSMDSRTRPYHAVEQIVGMDEDFEIWGELLNYPGDPSGSAKNVINCRCVVLYQRGA
jgi:uncharacterized protein with gpF-like domain